MKTRRFIVSGITLIMMSYNISSQNGYLEMRTDQRSIGNKEYKMIANGNKNTILYLPYKYPKDAIAKYVESGDIDEYSQLSIDFNKNGLVVETYNIIYNKYDAVNKKAYRFYPDNLIVSANGKFINGKCIEGTITYINGDTYTGSLNNWNYDGKGKVMHSNGICREGIWKEGAFMEGVILDENKEILQHYTKNDTYAKSYRKFDALEKYESAIGSYNMKISILKKYGEIKNENIQILLLKAIIAKDISAIKEAILLGANPNYGEDYGLINKPLTSAIQLKCNACIDEILPLLKSVGNGYVDPKNNVVNPLIAAGSDIILLTKLFEVYKADPNATLHSFNYNNSQHFYPVISYVTHLEAFKLFLEYGADPYIYSGMLYEEHKVLSEVPLIVTLAMTERNSFVDYLFSLKFNPVIQESVVADKFHSLFKPYQLLLLSRGTVGMKVLNRLIENGSAYNLATKSNYNQRPDYCDPTDNILSYGTMKESPGIYIKLLKLGAACKEVNLDATYESNKERSILSNSALTNTELIKALTKCKCD